MPTSTSLGLRHIVWRADESHDIAVEAADLLHAAAQYGAFVVAIAPAERLAAIDAVGVEPAVERIDVDQRARNPYRLVPFWLDVLERADGRPVVGLCESVHAGRHLESLEEAVRVEPLLNRALSGTGQLSLCCLVDATRVPAATADATGAAHHATVADAMAALTLDAADDGLPSTEPTAGLLPAVPAGATATSFADSADLGRLRELVRQVARTRVEDEDRIADLVLAVHELAANGLRHGGGTCHLSVWTDDRGVTCEVRDLGELIDPLEGLAPPPAEATAGRGLWLVHQLADLVQQRSGGDGTLTRVRLDRFDR